MKQLTAVKEYTDPVNFYLTHYDYDQAGNLIRQITANGEETILEYGSVFGPTHIVHPDGTSRSFLYDNVGNLLIKTDGNNFFHIRCCLPESVNPIP